MRISLIAVLMLLTPFLAKAFDYEAYQPVELERVVTKIEVDPNGTTYHIDGAYPRYRSRVTFTGQIRPLAGEVRTLVTYWAASMRHPPAIVELYQSEIEVVQGAERYWMPIQKQLVDAFLKEVDPYGHVTVYVLFMGGIDLTAVFAVSGFAAE